MAETNKPDYTYLWSSGGAIVAPSNVKIQTGWTAEVPPFQWENWSQNRQDQAISHILQKGISVWSSTGEYWFTTNGERSYVQGSDGNIYVATADSVGQNPVLDSTASFWRRAFNSANPLTSGALNLQSTIATSSTTAIFAADEIIVSTSLNGISYKISAYSKTLNVGTVGLGGMDIGAPPNNGYIAIYAIYNPFSNLSSIMAVNTTSIVAPPTYTGVNAPSGYTASALLTVVPTTAGGLIKACTVKGRSVGLQLTAFFSFAANIPAQNISISGAVPRNAIEITGELSGNSTTTASIGMNIYSDVTSFFGQQNLSFTLPAGGNPQIGNYSNVPLTTLQMVGISASCTAGTPAFSFYITGYKI